MLSGFTRRGCVVVACLTLAACGGGGGGSSSVSISSGSGSGTSGSSGSSGSSTGTQPLPVSYLYYSSKTSSTTNDVYSLTVGNGTYTSHKISSSTSAAIVRGAVVDSNGRLDWDYGVMEDGGRMYLVTPTSDTPQRISSYNGSPYPCTISSRTFGTGTSNAFALITNPGSTSNCSTSTASTIEQIPFNSSSTTSPQTAGIAFASGIAVDDGTSTLKGFVYVDSNNGYLATFDTSGHLIQDLTSSAINKAYDVHQSSGMSNVILQAGSSLYLVSVSNLFSSSFSLPVTPLFKASSSTEVDGNGKIPVFVSGQYAYFVDGYDVYKVDMANTSASPVKVGNISSVMAAPKTFPILLGSDNTLYILSNDRKELISVDMTTGAAKNLYTDSGSGPVQNVYLADGNAFFSVKASNNAYTAYIANPTDGLSSPKLSARWMSTKNVAGSQPDLTQNILLNDGASAGAGNDEIVGYDTKTMQPSHTYGTIANQDYRAVASDQIAQHDYLFLQATSNSQTDLYLLNLETDSSLHQVTNTPSANESPM